MPILFFFSFLQFINVVDVVFRQLVENRRVQFRNDRTIETWRKFHLALQHQTNANADWQRHRARHRRQFRSQTIVDHCS